MEIFQISLTLISLACAGLLAGLIMTVAFVLPRYWRAYDHTSRRPSFATFLETAKGNPLVTLLMLLAVFAPLVNGVICAVSGDGLQAALEIGAGASFLLLFFGVTVVLNLPIYREVLRQRDTLSEEQLAALMRRFFALNLFRLTGALLAFGLLAASLVMA